MQKTALLIFLFTSTITFGQKKVLNALVSQNVIEVGGNFTISFQFNSSSGDFTPPSNLTKNFRVLSGPNSSTQMAFVNGKVTSNKSYSYVLSPLREGDFIIEAAEIELDDKIYSSKPVKIKVVEASEARKQQAEQEAKKHVEQTGDIKNNLFLRLEVSKKTVYQGEQILAIYKLYNRARLNNIEGQRMPEFDGFYTSDIELDKNKSHTREVINGIQYDVFVLKKTILIPQKTGQLVLIPLELDASVQIQSDKPVNTFFGPRYQFKNVMVSLKSNAIKIKVKPLPSGAPDGFQGAVGNFKFKASLSPSNLTTNAPLTLSMKISGSGNIPLINAPTNKWPQEFEVYDPKLKSNVSNKSGLLSGSKKWEYLAIPRNIGEYTFDPVVFTFFNLSTKKYETITADLSTINVSASTTENGTPNPTRSITKQDVSRLGTDIRFVHLQNPQLRNEGELFFRSIWFYFWMITPILLTGLAYIILRKQSQLQSDTVGMKKRKATQVAKKQLKHAQSTLKTNDTNAFYEAVFKALNGYLGNKVAISNANLNKPNIKKVLSAHRVQQSTITRLLETLDYCEMARFAPRTDISSQNLLAQAQDIIVKLEDEIK